MGPHVHAIVRGARSDNPHKILKHRMVIIVCGLLLLGDNTQHVIKVNRSLVADAATLQQPNKAEFENRRKTNRLHERNLRRTLLYKLVLPSPMPFNAEIAMGSTARIRVG